LTPGGGPCVGAAAGVSVLPGLCPAASGDGSAGDGDGEDGCWDPAGVDREGGAGVCLAWTALGFAAGSRLTGTAGTTGAADTSAGRATSRGAARRSAATVGATTTLRPGPGSIARLREVTGVERSREINATPTTAIASKKAARTRSLRLMPLRSSGDNIPTGSIGSMDVSLYDGMRLGETAFDTLER
jgi:hypothetical protein